VKENTPSMQGFAWYIMWTRKTFDFHGRGSLKWCKRNDDATISERGLWFFKTMMQPTHRIFKRCDDATIFSRKIPTPRLRSAVSDHIHFLWAWKWVATYSGLFPESKPINEAQNVIYSWFCSKLSGANGTRSSEN